MDYSSASITITGTFTAHNQGRANFGPIGTVDGQQFDLMVVPTSGGLPSSFTPAISGSGFPYISASLGPTTCPDSSAVTGCTLSQSTAICTGASGCAGNTNLNMAQFEFSFVRHGTDQLMPPFGDFAVSFYDLDGGGNIVKEIVSVRGAAPQLAPNTAVVSGQFPDGSWYAEAADNVGFGSPNTPADPGAEALRASATYHMTGGNLFYVSLGGRNSGSGNSGRAYFFSNNALDFGTACPPPPPPSTRSASAPRPMVASCYHSTALAAT